MEITGCEDGSLGWMIKHLSAELLQEMCWLLSHVWPSVIMRQGNTGTKHPALLVLNGPSQFPQCFTVMLSIHLSPLIRKSARRVPLLSQNTIHITFNANKFCLNFVLQGDPSWCQCIDYCLVSGVMCVFQCEPTALLWALGSTQGG